MSLLFRVVRAHECSGTHHKLAIDALQHLQGEQAAAWGNLLLYHFDAYLEGSKAPDTRFKDFRNHVLHVGENFWGGAIEACQQWYDTTVQLLSQRKWREAAQAAGVLSHYYTDPLMPFHTGQSEEETQIHRAVEWSITKSYDELAELLVNELGGFPKIAVPQSEQWLAEMVKQGARAANKHYQMLIEHYDFSVGVKNPPQGLDQPMRVALAAMLGHAVVGLAGILDRAFLEAAVEPPKSNLTLAGYLSLLTVPIAAVQKKLVDVRDRSQVKAMFDELQKTGRVQKTLPEDDRQVRELHAAEVLKRPLSELDAQPLRPMGAKHTAASNEPQTARQPAVAKAARTPAAQIRKPVETPLKKEPVTRDAPTTKRGDTNSPRFHLELASDLVDAPSIGKKTADRFLALGIKSVAQFLAAEPAKLAASLATSWITAELLGDWQHQASLVCRIPNLRGHDAQLLVGCGYRTPESITAAEASRLHAAVIAYCGTSQGQRVLREAKPPELAEIQDWIRCSRQSRSGKAA